MLKIEMNLNKSFSILDNNLYLNEFFSNAAIAIYSLLQRNYISAKGFSINSINILANYLYSANNRRINEKIIEGINELIENELILVADMQFKPIENISNLGFNTLFYVGFNLPDTEYFKIMDKDLDNLFLALKDKKYKNIDKLNICRFYIACCRVFNCDARYGYITQSSSAACGYNSSTVSRYLGILQDVGLIYYNNSYLTPEKHYTKTYVAAKEYEDSEGKIIDNKNRFEACLKQEIEWNKLVHTDKVKSNARRSASKKINNTKKKIEELEQANLLVELAKAKEEIEQLKAEKEKLKYKSDNVVKVVTKKQDNGFWGSNPNKDNSSKNSCLTKHIGKIRPKNNIYSDNAYMDEVLRDLDDYDDGLSY
ncbi:hypothetical protein IAI10_20325 [Clostridium sp. 19966]|uniref:hypothetical protein n=1 Tax=Clostridium sp. 19966 TaxID=2768166 RepID=UPI0028E02C7F|nr:hypothetical protein [Clostridium sp. 19966]MDT8719004.1 hypothetical protein [Clostridium sp. 19966]